MKKAKCFLTAVMIVILGLFLSACGDAAEKKQGPNTGAIETPAASDQGAEETIISGEGVVPGRTNFHIDSFGENIWIFAPEDDPELVQQELDALSAIQETNHFGDDRYSVYFLPGTYDKQIEPKVGFYMQVAGLGASPDDVSLFTVGTDAAWAGGSALVNFWRGVENLSARSSVTWAVSQATFMRRVNLGSSLRLHDSNGAASGGFLANSKVATSVDSGSQQQWFSRNCDWDIWRGEGWSRVFAGIEEGKSPEGTWPEHTYTDIPAVEEMREKPFLAYDGEKGFGVYVPQVRTAAVGVDWTPGEFLPMEDFYIAKPLADTAETINAALQAGKHLFLTPGVYELTEPIIVDREGTIVLGTGLATLRSMEGSACLEVVGDARVILAGILFDAGPKETEYLLAVGTGADPAKETENPETDCPATLMADIFFRVGGAFEYDTDVECCVEIYQDGVIGDNFWVWRADHGYGVGWDINRAKNGILVAGDDVTIYALMVEHFQEYQTIWEGENGKIIFYQCEVPYDVPDQESWLSHDGAVNGFASIKIADTVRRHESWGVGVYLYNRDTEVELYTAMEVPQGAEGVKVHHIFTIMLAGYPGMSHIINGEGDAVLNPGEKAIIIEWNE